MTFTLYTTFLIIILVQMIRSGFGIFTFMKQAERYGIDAWLALVLGGFCLYYIAH